MADKPIYERIDRSKFLKSAQESAESIHQLIEDDKRMVEARLKSSKIAEYFELTGIRADNNEKK